LLGLCLALAIVVASRWINSPGFGPTIPEGVVDLLCLALIGWGFCLRITAHRFAPAWAPVAPPPGEAISQVSCAGTFLLGSGLALMLHDAMVLGVFTLFFCLWWAVAAQSGRDPDPAERDSGWRDWWRPRVVGVGLRREAAVLVLSLIAAIMIE